MDEYFDTDPVTSRADILTTMATNVSKVRNAAAREKLLHGMNLVLEGMARLVRPQEKVRPAPLLPIKGGRDANAPD